MKTTLISALALTLALFSIPALAQGNKNAAGGEWFNCFMNFQKEVDDYGTAIHAAVRATKDGTLIADSKTICAFAKVDNFIIGVGEACLHLGKAVPKNAPGKQFATKMTKKISVTLMMFQGNFIRDRAGCERLQAEEEAAQKEESPTKAPLPPGHSRITTTITTITTTTTKKDDAPKGTQNDL